MDSPTTTPTRNKELTENERYQDHLKMSKRSKKVERHKGSFLHINRKKACAVAASDCHHH